MPDRLQEGVRRGLELALSGAGLVLLSPVLLAISVLILLDSGRPVLYRGRRMGRGGRCFWMLKFRTLPAGTEAKVGGRLLRPEEEGEATRLGRLLRRSKLDELPQLYNVLAGDMSLVGPRANRPSYFAECAARIPGYHERIRVKPGMTGLAQVFGDYYTPPHAKLRYDRLYLSRRSLRVDLWLMMMTAARLAAGRAAVRRRPRLRPRPAPWQPAVEEAARV